MSTARRAARAAVVAMLLAAIAAVAAPATPAAQAASAQPQVTPATAPQAAVAPSAAATSVSSVSRDGMAMLPFEKVMKEAGASVRFDSAAGEFRVRLNGTDIIVPVYDVYAVVGGRTVRMSRGPVVVQGVVYIAQDFVEGLLSGGYTGWEWNDPRPGNGDRVVSLEPGHTWTAPRDGLRFRFAYMNGDPDQIGLRVRNASGADITLAFPSGKTHEIVILRNGRKIWSSSDGESYIQAIQNVTLRAGETKTYWATMPLLAPGRYTVRGYLPAVSKDRSVVETTLTVGNAAASYDYYDPLQYGLSFRQGSGSNPPSLMLTVKNPTNRQVVFPARHTYEIVIWGTDGSVTRKTLPGMSAGGATQVVRAGALQQHFIYLRGLARGRYYAEGYIKQGGKMIRTIGGVSFTIR